MIATSAQIQLICLRVEAHRCSATPIGCLAGCIRNPYVELLVKKRQVASADVALPPRYFDSMSMVPVGDKPKRTRLMNQDTVAAKFLDPYAVSPLIDVEQATLWRLVSGGDKWAAFWSELAATDEHGGDYRHGVFLSRFAEVCLNAGRELCSNADFGKCIVPKVLCKAKQEFERLKARRTKTNIWVQTCFPTWFCVLCCLHSKVFCVNVRTLCLCVHSNCSSQFVI